MTQHAHATDGGHEHEYQPQGRAERNLSFTY